MHQASSATPERQMVRLSSKGNSVTGFSNTEDEAIGLTRVVSFPLEDSLVANGGRLLKDTELGTMWVIHGCLITGQNPASSGPTARELLKVLQA